MINKECSSKDLIYYATEYDKLIQKEENTTDQELASQKPIYIMYSKDKFKSLYGKREWWKVSNFFDANLGKFNSSNNYKVVYDNNGVTIWKLEKDISN